MRTRHKVAAGGAALAAVLLLLLSLAREDQDVPDAPVASGAMVPAVPRPAPVPTRAVRAAPQPDPPRVPPAPPVFDSVQVEKDEVCEGEENLVSVRAHTLDGNDAFLQYTVAGEAGAQVPVRSFLGRDGSAPPQYAVAFTRDNVAARIEIPRWRVKDCRVSRMLVVTMRMLPNSTGEREFTATVQTLEGPPFAPAWFEWSFGDGSSATTGGPRAAHDYSTLPQKTAFTDLIVRVRARDGAGESVEGRYPLHVRNLAFFSRQRGVALIFAEPNPRFPLAGPGGGVRQTFRLWHAEESPVRIDGATMARLLSPAAPGSAPAPPAAIAVDPATLWRAREIPAGGSIEETMEYDFGADGAAYGVVYEVQGVTADGMRARGEIAILKPPPALTRENSIPIDDPAFADRIRRAMEILQQPTVTQEDLFRLEREGKLR